jgi:hypothetical protein
MSYTNETKRVRQWRILQIAPESMVMMLKGLCKGDMVTARGLPLDAEVAGAFLDPNTQTVNVYMDSEEFDPIRQGMAYPHLLVEITNISEQARMAGIFVNRRPERN